MRNLSERMHKPSTLLRKLHNESSHLIQDEDPEHQDRLDKALRLHSKGYSQSEIASKLKINQSTVSRDLAEILSPIVYRL